MNHTDKLKLSDLLILHDESEHEITDMAYEYYIPYSNAPERLAAEFHNALKLNIAIGEMLLETMAEEAIFPSFDTLSDHPFSVPTCTLPFLEESIRIQKGIAESHDTMMEIEKQYNFLTPQRHLGL